MASHLHKCLGVPRSRSLCDVSRYQQESFRMRFSADTYRLMQPALGGCVGGQRIPVAPGGRAVRPGAVGRRAALTLPTCFRFIFL